MSEKRESFIGARFTKEEKIYIQKFAKEIKMSMSDFVREAIFSHLNFLDSNKGNLEKLEFVLISQKSNQIK